MPIYYIDNTIYTCDTHNDLGIYTIYTIYTNCIQFDKYLYFDKHILYCCRGAILTINNLFRCFIINYNTLLIKTYITYASTNVEFSTTVWNPGLRVFTRRLFGSCG